VRTNGGYAMKLFQRDLEVGEAVRIGGLTVYPLLGSDEGGLDYLTAPEALGVGLTEVSELDHPSVPSLRVTNLADVPVLFVEGQTLLGGAQNRTMNVSVLVPAKSQTSLPVSCVEAHRWNTGTGRTYRAAGKVAPGSLRSAKIGGLDYRRETVRMRSSDQGQVWEEVRRLEVGHQAFSDTAALDDLQERIEAHHATNLNRVVSQPGQVGVVCVAAGRVVGLDLFDKSSTLEQFLRAIVGGHTLDAAMGDQSEETTDGIQVIEAFLALVEAARVERADAVGLGGEILLQDAVNGVGLELEGTLVHLAAFPVSTEPRARRRTLSPLT
jgi:hypothetical protein